MISFVFRGDAFRTIERCLQGWSRFPREAHHRHRAKSSRKVVALRSWEVSIEIDSGHCVAVCLAFWFVEQVTRNVAPLDGQRFTFGAQKSLRLESSPNKMMDSRKSLSELACSFLRTIVSEGLNICSNPLKRLEAGYFVSASG